MPDIENPRGFDPELDVPITVREAPVSVDLPVDMSQHQAVVNEIVDTICRSRCSFKELADAMLKEHRTRQQMFAGFLVAAISRWAECHDAGTFDLRNEATCKLAHEIVTRMGDDWPRNPLPYI